MVIIINIIDMDNEVNAEVKNGIIQFDPDEHNFHYPYPDQVASSDAVRFDEVTSIWEYDGEFAEIDSDLNVPEYLGNNTSNYIEWEKFRVDESFADNTSTQGWTQYQTSEGDIYFYHEETQTVQWESPYFESPSSLSLHLTHHDFYENSSPYLNSLDGGLTVTSPNDYNYIAYNVPVPADGLFLPLHVDDSDFPPVEVNQTVLYANSELVTEGSSKSFEDSNDSIEYFDDNQIDKNLENQSPISLMVALEDTALKAQSTLPSLVTTLRKKGSMHTTVVESNLSITDSHINNYLTKSANAKLSDVRVLKEVTPSDTSDFNKIGTATVETSYNPYFSISAAATSSVSHPWVNTHAALEKDVSSYGHLVSGFELIIAYHLLLLTSRTYLFYFVVPAIFRVCVRPLG